MRHLRSLLAALLSCVAVLTPVGSAAAQYPPPIVEITPATAYVSNSGLTLAVSIKWCMQYGGTYWQHREVKWGSGVDVTSQFSMTGWGQDTTCEGYEIWTATLSLAESPVSQTLTAYGLDYMDYGASHTANYSVPEKRHGARVVAHAAFVNVTPSTSTSQPFTVRNVGEVLATYTLSTSCTGATSGCSALVTSLQLAAGDSEVVSVDFATSSAVNDTGLVKLTATDDETGSITQGWVDVTIRNAPSTGVVLARSLGRVSRSSCVTASLGSDVAMECGDLRVTHALPAIRTVGKDWVPTLLHASQQANPQPVVLADITLPTGSLPTSVQVQVYVDGTQRGSSTYSGSNWGAGGNTRRIALQVDASGLGTSLRSYYVTATLIGGPGGVLTSATEKLAIVDRSASPYGAGWWLAGLEELHVQNSTTLLWVGGDGSTRVYTLSGSKYVTDRFNAPDSITTSGTDFIRWGPASLQVRFNASGLHTSTTNRLWQIVSFAYVSGTRRLSSITIPVTTAPTSPVYTFSYNGSNVLYQVTAPNAGTSRTVTISHGSTYQNTAITDPDGKVVYFGFGSGGNAHRIDNRTDRRGFVMSLSYNSFNRLTGSSLANGSQTIAQVLSAAETQGASTAVDPDSVYTMIDGPRSDVSDVIKLWINRHGAPERIRNADGQETRLKYDLKWPALVSESRSPSRLRTRAFFDTTRARPDSTIVYGPLGTTANAKTAYTWHPDWLFVTSITPPAGPVTEIQYSSNGNRQWEQTGGSSRRTTYTYNGSGFLTTITPPAGGATSLDYNSLGNVSETTSPKGYKSYVFQNAIGQDTMTASPSDTTKAGIESDVVTYGTRVRNVYDIVGQLTQSTTHGPGVTTGLSTSVPADSLRIEYQYDAEGNDTASTRRFWPTGMGGSGFILVSRSSYDGAGRKVTEDSPGASTKTFGYDPAGNVTSIGTGRGHTLTMAYDAVNRLTRRVVPQVTYSAIDCSTFFNFPLGCFWDFPTIGSSFCINPDTSHFEYDAAGNMTAADNRYARVRRSYTPSGWLAGDNLQIRYVKEAGTHPCGTADPDAAMMHHSYVMTSTYDVVGRRTQLSGPYYLTGCSANPCATSWAYSGGAGELSSVTDGLGRTTSFTYDYASRLTDINFANGVTDHMTLDAAGQVVARTVSGSSVGAIDDVIAYDAMGRIKRGTLGKREGITYNQSVDTWYGPLGAAVEVSGATKSATGSMVTEQFTVDPLGNRTFTKQQHIKPSWHPDANGERYLSYDSYKRLSNVYYSATGFWHDKNIEYDGSGNVFTTALDEKDYNTSSNLWDASINYYDAADRLRGFNRAIGPYANDETHPGQRNVFEEYFYDALGRRVLVRSRRTSSCSAAYTECGSYVERTIWDGDQVVAEVRAPGGTSATTSEMENDAGTYTGYDANKYGLTAYVHAGGIDQPIVVMRSGLGSSLISVYPHQNWRGTFELGTTTTGTLFTAYQIAWPGARGTVDGEVGNPGDGPVWFGGLIPGKADGSGMQYMRNRYYDPASGRFTQQDPIGLAGGMNLYGFAAGDPITFSDPFGLCPIPTASLQCVISDAIAGARASIAGQVASVASRMSLYVRASSGVFGVQTEINDEGPAIRTGPGIGSQALGLAFGAALRLADTPDNSIVLRGSRRVGPTVKGGGFSVTTTRAVRSDGSGVQTSAGIEFGWARSRTSTGRGGVIGGSARSSELDSCFGSGCKNP
jgi:RHS repeat-associated protein